MNEAAEEKPTLDLSKLTHDEIHERIRRLDVMRRIRNCAVSASKPIHKAIRLHILSLELKA